jgi:hypothetical protein
MPIKILPSLTAALLVTLFASGPARADAGAPGWEAAKAAIAKEYAIDEASGDRIDSISENGQPEIYPFYVRRYGKLLIDRKDKTREEHKVWVDFVLVNHQWEVEAIGGLEFKALADVKPPPASDAQRLLEESWKTCEGFTVEGVQLKGEPEFQREPGADRAKARRGYVYSAVVTATGTGAARLSTKGAGYQADGRFLLWMDPTQRTWSVDKRALRCNFQQVKEAPHVDEKPASIPGTQAAAPGDAAAQKAFQQAWTRARPDFEVKAVALSKPGEVHKSGAKSWVTCNLVIDVVGTSQGPKEWAGKKLRCTPEDFSSVINWSAADSAWVVDEKTVKDVNERGACVLSP